MIFSSSKIGDLTIAEFRALMAEFLPAKVPVSNKLLTVQQVADLLGYKISNIYALTHRREIPFMKKGRKLWFNEDEIQEWIKSGRKKTVAELQESLKIKQGKIISTP